MKGLSMKKLLFVSLLFATCAATPSFAGWFSSSFLKGEGVKDMTVKDVFEQIMSQRPAGLGNSRDVAKTSTWERGPHYQKFFTYYIPFSDDGYDDGAVEGIENYCNARGAVMTDKGKTKSVSRFDCMSGDNLLFAAFFSKGPRIHIVSSTFGTFAVINLVEPREVGTGHNDPMEEFHYATVTKPENYYSKGTISFPSLEHGAAATR